MKETASSSLFRIRLIVLVIVINLLQPSCSSQTIKNENIEVKSLFQREKLHSLQSLLKEDQSRRIESRSLGRLLETSNDKSINREMWLNLEDDRYQFIDLDKLKHKEKTTTKEISLSLSKLNILYTKITSGDRFGLTLSSSLPQNSTFSSSLLNSLKVHPFIEADPRKQLQKLNLSEETISQPSLKASFLSLKHFQSQSFKLDPFDNYALKLSEKSQSSPKLSLVNLKPASQKVNSKM